MSLLALIKLSYFVAATLLLLGLQRMASPKTARSGIQWAGVGMLIATVATFFLPGLHNIALMVVAIVLGVGLNWAWGKKVAITDMPQMVALFNGMGGGSAAAIGAVELVKYSGGVPVPSMLGLVLAVVGALIRRAQGLASPLLRCGAIELDTRSGQLSVGETLHQTVKADFDAEAVDDAATLAQIRETFQASGYILDPHTAIGVRAAAGRADCICLATAHPAKFNEAVTAAIGQAAPPPTSLQGLMDKPTRCAVLDAEVGAVKGHLRATLAARV